MATPFEFTNLSPYEQLATQQLLDQSRRNPLQEMISAYQAPQKAAQEQAAAQLAQQIQQATLQKMQRDIDPVYQEQLFQRELEKQRALYGMRPQLSLVQDPVTGAVNVVDKKALTARGVTQVGGADPFTTGVKPTFTELVDPGTGIKYRFAINPDGSRGAQIGATELPRGNTMQDPITGKVSVVNPFLPTGVGPGQAADVTVAPPSPATDSPTPPTGPVPFTVSPKPTPGAKSAKLSEDEKKMLLAGVSQSKIIPGMVEEFKTLQKQGLAGPIAGKYQAGKAALGYGGTAFTQAQSKVKGNLFKLARALQGGGVLTEQDITRMEAIAPPLDVNEDQFIGGMRGVAELMNDNLRSFLELNGSRLDQEASESVTTSINQLDRFINPKGKTKSPVATPGINSNAPSPVSPSSDPLGLFQ